MEKQRWEESEKRRKKIREEKEPEERRCRCAKSRDTLCFSNDLWLRSRLAKVANAEPCGQMRDERLHAVVARSTFRSQKCTKLAVLKHFWKLRCSKSARPCGAKHISKSKCTKHCNVGHFWKLNSLKKCRPLWREAHFEVKSVQNWRLEAFLEVNVQKVHAVVEVKSVKNWRCGSTFWSSDVEKVHADVMRSKCRAKKNQNTQHSCHFWAFTTRRQQLLQLQLPLHYTNYTTLHYTTLHYATLRYATLHYTTLHYTTLQRHRQLHYIYSALHYIPSHYFTLHYTTLLQLQLQVKVQLQLQLHHITLHYTN